MRTVCGHRSVVVKSLVECAGDSSRKVLPRDLVERRNRESMAKYDVRT